MTDSRTETDSPGVIESLAADSGRRTTEDAMKVTRRFVFSSALFCVLAPQAALPDHGHPPVVRSDAAASPAWTELASAMQRMHRAMASVPPSGNSDRGFVELMLPHHQAAIDMARTELLHGGDPKMRRLAQEIITDQQSEIDLMRLWLKQHGSDAEAIRPPAGSALHEEH